MGLAASQARLLTLTARLSDLELRAQQISNSKTRLATQQEQVSKAYSDALAQEKLTFSSKDSSGNVVYKDLNANLLLAYDTTSLDSQRLLKDSYDRVLVTDAMAKNYQASGGKLETFLNSYGYTEHSPASQEATYKTNLTTTLANNLTSELSKFSISSTVTTVPTPVTTYATSTTYEATTTVTKNTTAGTVTTTLGCLSSNSQNELDKIDNYLDAVVKDLTTTEEDTVTALGTTTLTNISTTNAKSLIDEFTNLESLYSSNAQKVAIIEGYKALATSAYNQLTTVNTYTTLADRATYETNLEKTFESYKAIDLDSLGDQLASTVTTTGSTVTTMDQAVTTYSTTTTNADMTAQINSLSDILNSIPTSFKGDQITSYLSQENKLLNAAKAAISADGGTLSSSVLSSINDAISNISPARVSLLLGYSSLTDSACISAVNSYNYDSNAVQYYSNYFNAMGGGTTNNYITASNSCLSSEEWLQNQLTNGNLSLEKYDSTASTFNSETISTDSAIVKETDDTQTAKAEADYKSATAEIETKDSRFDLELNNINTEHSSIQTEIDSVKKIIDKNVERSFKVFNA